MVMNWRIGLPISVFALSASFVCGRAFAATESWAPAYCQKAQQSLAKDADVMAQLQGAHGSPQAISAEKAKINADQASEKYYCQPTQPGSNLGTLTPRYMVLFVIYAPPGSTVGQGVSKVDYTSDSTAGTTETSSKSFKASTKITASVSANEFGATQGLNVSYSQSLQDSTKTSVEVKKTASLDVHDSGPSTDGIDHDFDEIWIWTNPSVGMMSQGTNFSTVLGTQSGKPVSLQFLTVGQAKRFIAAPGCLNQPTPSDTNFCQQLKSAGFTTADYQGMLTADPFAWGSVPLDPNRFIQTSTTFPYEPGGTTVTFTANNEATNVNTSSQTTVKALSIAVTVGYSTPAVKATLQVADSYTWTHEYSQASSLATSQKAGAVVGAPSTNWEGPQNIGIYYDCLWNTFYFQYLDPIGNPILLTGLLVDAEGRPVAHQQVTLTYPGRIMRTYSNSKGQYSFFGHAPKAAGQIRANALATTKVNLESQAQHLDLKMFGLVKKPKKIQPKS